MGIRVLTTVIDADEHRGNGLDAACLLAKEWQARLKALFTQPEVSFSYSTESTVARHAGITEDIRRVEKAQLVAARALFHASCAAHGIAAVSEQEIVEGPHAVFISYKGPDPLRWIVWHARHSDFAVLERPDGPDADRQTMLLDLALRETGRAVLMIPPLPPAKLHFRTVAIAWNGSAEAAHAASAALEIIARAERVLIMTAESARTSARSAHEFAAYLAAHGVKATTDVFPKQKGGSVGATLAEKCRHNAADLLVMGAYSHSRFREMVLGGVTRYVVKSAGIPVLMAH